MSAKAQATAVRPFLERIQEGVVVCDGAMGTMLYARGVFVNRCFDELNLSSPAARARGPRGVRRGRRGRGGDQHLRRPPPEARAPRVRGAGGEDQPRGRAAGPRGGARPRPGGGLHRARSASRWSRSATSRSPTRWTSTASRSRACSRAGSTSSRSRRCRRSTRPGRRWTPSASQSDLPVVVSLTFNEEGHDVLRRQARGRGAHARGLGRAGGGRELQPGPAAHAGDGAAHGRGGRRASSSPRCRTRAPPRWWTGATCTCARRSTWPRTRGASSARA